MAINFTFSQVNNSHFAQVAGGGQPRFLVGNEVVYLHTKHGLAHSRVLTGLTYDPANYVGQHGFWAYFIAPTAKAESKNSFVCLNTYDNALFTFGFMQYAAHVPNGDFVRYFKRLLAFPNAQDYFPKLVLNNNRIFYRDTNGTLTQLEDNTSTQKLMNYLNPSLNAVENQELICSARMVHWASNDAAHRALQVDTAIEFFKENMREYASIYNLDGYPDKICQVICDIRHQGRAKSQHIINALNTSNLNTAYTRLLQLGQDAYPERINTIRSVINNLVTQGIFNKVYRAATNDFV